MTGVSVRKERKVWWDIFALFFPSAGQNLFNQKSNQSNMENFAKGYRKHHFCPSTDHSFNFLSTLLDRQGGYKVFSLWKKKSQLWAVQIWCKMSSLWFYWWKDFWIWGGCVRMQPILNNRRRIRELLEFKKFDYQSQIFLCKTIHIVPCKLRQVPKRKQQKKHKKWVKPVYGIVPNPHY